MRLVEYEAKQLLAGYGIPVPKGALVLRGTACEMEGLSFPVVIKAQLKAGGRGKAGAIKVVEKREDLGAALEKMFATAYFGQMAEKILVEEFVPHEREYYLACAIARKSKKYALMLSSAGGVEIESNADLVSIVEIDPLVGLMEHHVRELMFRAGIEAAVKPILAEAIRSLYRSFTDSDAQIAEINPLAIGASSCVALDGKVIIDDGSLMRHAELRERVGHEAVGGSFAETMERLGMNMQEQQGEIAILTGGAGRMMATLDLLSAMGGSFRAFGELGVVVFQPDKMKENMKVLIPALLSLKPRVMLLSICWVLADCEAFALALGGALDEVDLQGVPMVVRICGNKQDAAHAIMSRYTDRVILKTDLVEACESTVKLLGGAA